MSQKNFNTIAGAIFLIVAILHLWRVIGGIDVAFGSTMIPIWISWLGVIVGAVLGYYGIKHGRV